MRGFNTVVVIGSGDIACKCIKILADHHDNVVCIEHEKGYLSMMKSICQKYNCRYKAITEQEQLLEYFNKITVKTLIVSANNNYIFPEAVLDKQNLSVINFHNALLPHHGGRNAPTWAIFQMDETTGITWHEVTPKVDAGDIIIQRGIVIAQDMTALELARKCMEVGAEAEITCRKLHCQGATAGKRDGVPLFRRHPKCRNNGYQLVYGTDFRFPSFVRLWKNKNTSSTKGSLIGQMLCD